MTRCKYIAKVITEFDYDKGWLFNEIQCANEKGHVKGHLIVVGEE